MKRPLPDWCEEGASFRYLAMRWHVRGIVDGQAVCRRWRIDKRRWAYDVIDVALLHLHSNAFTKIKRAKKPDPMGFMMIDGPLGVDTTTGSIVMGSEIVE
jgi:hypothetical protein